MYLADLQIEHFKVGEYQEDLWILLKLTHVTLPQESPSFVQECPFHRSLLFTGVSFAQESPWYRNLLTTACCFVVFIIPHVCIVQILHCQVEEHQDEGNQFITL